MKNLNPVSRAFRVLVSLAVILPLGPGGLCCCVVHGDHARAAVTPVHAAAPRSCCTPSAPDAPAPPSKSSRDDCKCPQRENVVLGSASSDAAMAAPVTGAHVTLIAVTSSAPGIDVSRARNRADCPAPVPRLPLYRALGVLLC